MASNYTTVPDAFEPWRAEILSLGVTKNYLMLSSTQLMASAAALGAILHLTLLLPYEVEQFMYTLLGGLLASWTGYFFFQIVLGFSVLSSAFRVLLVSSAFNAGIFVSIGFYRLFFHRLRRFPGPLLAKLTKFFSVSLAVKTVQYHKDVARMHDEYGDFIRTGPRELCIVRSSAVPLIYGPNAKCRKATWYTQVDTNAKNCSINMTRDVDDYRRRRRTWDRGFATKVLQQYIPRITEKADLYLSFDIMGEAGFGKDFGGLANGQEHPAIKGVHDHMAILSIASHVPWLLNIASRIPGATAGYAPFFNWCTSQIQAKQKTWKHGQEPTDIISWLIKAFEEKDPSAPPSTAAMHEDARVVIIAGSETTATTLAAVLFYLCKYPEIYRKLQADVDAALPASESWSYEKAKTVTFIDDLVNETLRLKPAIMSGGYRVTPPQGMQVDEHFIPGNTNVFVPTQLIQTDERYWPRGHEFIPERFSSKSSDLRNENAPFMPFTLGMHACPGKNLALMSLRIILSKIAQNYDVSFGSGENGDLFDTQALDTFTTTLPPVIVQFTKRAR
ncbi:cytochrome P450 [Apiospora kogelbergensis]|uniref:cytochrome P450 n=1 Tax=Apiospora kogelbergensis TaxID=1337665 RepID=UPI003131560A